MFAMCVWTRWLHCGTLPEWLAAVGIVGALFVALRLSGRELAARRAAAEDREKDQARLISAWAQMSSEGGLGTVMLRNGSGEPAYDVSIYGTSDVYDEPPIVFQLAVLPPGETIDTRAHPPGPYMAEIPPMDLAFTDSRGTRWRRLAAGAQLEKVPPSREERRHWISQVFRREER
jgi:hypothetical protein